MKTGALHFLLLVSEGPEAAWLSEAWCPSPNDSQVEESTKPSTGTEIQPRVSLRVRAQVLSPVVSAGTSQRCKAAEDSRAGGGCCGVWGHHLCDKHLGHKTGGGFGDPSGKACRLCQSPGPQGLPVCEEQGRAGTWKAVQVCQLRDIEGCSSEAQMHI